ncbi:hypothetical protein FGG78_30930 [Thioclava sp. BHET1]|nr:hypothetical protein FGG78_30930 [Thioclava sp. BHET1]
MRRPRLTRAEIEALEQEARELKAEAQQRLVSVAEAIGFFRAVVPRASIEAALRAAMVRERRKAGAPPRIALSKLGKMEKKILTARKTASQEARALDARRKILLGSFLIAQFQHFPTLLPQLRGALSAFLDLHKTAGVRATNRALLADVLEGDGPKPSPAEEEKGRTASKEERALDARRKILLGSFLMAQFQSDPALHTALQDELSKFLNLHKDPGARAQNRALLADFLGSGTAAPAPSEQENVDAE